jgi:hypothetical protein
MKNVEQEELTPFDILAEMISRIKYEVLEYTKIRSARVGQSRFDSFDEYEKWLTDGGNFRPGVSAQLASLKQLVNSVCNAFDAMEKKSKEVQA